MGGKNGTLPASARGRANARAAIAANREFHTKPRFMFHEKEKQRYGSTPAIGNASVRYSPYSQVSLPGFICYTDGRLLLHKTPHQNQ